MIDSELGRLLNEQLDLIKELDFLYEIYNK